MLDSPSLSSASTLLSVPPTEIALLLPRDNNYIHPAHGKYIHLIALLSFAKWQSHCCFLWLFPGSMQ